MILTKRYFHVRVRIRSPFQFLMQLYFLQVWKSCYMQQLFIAFMLLFCTLSCVRYVQEEEAISSHTLNSFCFAQAFQNLSNTFEQVYSQMENGKNIKTCNAILDFAAFLMHLGHSFYVMRLFNKDLFQLMITFIAPSLKPLHTRDLEHKIVIFIPSRGTQIDQLQAGCLFFCLQQQKKTKSDCMRGYARSHDEMQEYLDPQGTKL